MHMITPEQHSSGSAASQVNLPFPGLIKYLQKLDRPNQAAVDSMSMQQAVTELVSNNATGDDLLNIVPDIALDVYFGSSDGKSKPSAYFAFLGEVKKANPEWEMTDIDKYIESYLDDPDDNKTGLIFGPFSEKAMTWIRKSDQSRIFVPLLPPLVGLARTDSDTLVKILDKVDEEGPNIPELEWDALKTNFPAIDRVVKILLQTENPVTLVELLPTPEKNDNN